MAPADLAARIALRDRLDPEYPGYHDDQRAWLAARAEIVAANLGLVPPFARKLLPCAGSLTFEDLVQVGAIGLVAAADRFEPARGFAFESYAEFRIRAAIQAEVVATGSLVRVPCHLHPAGRSRCRRGAAVAPAADHELSRRLRRVRTGQKQDDREFWQDQALDRSRLEARDGLEPAAAARLRRAVERRLTPAERSVVVGCYFPAAGTTAPPRDEVAAALGIAANTARVLANRAIGKLRAALEPERDEWAVYLVG